MKLKFLTLVLLIISSSCKEKEYEKDELLFEENFEGDLSQWVIETGDSPDANAGIKEGKLVIDVDRGATVWLKEELSGNILIEYERKVILENGKNDRLSDLNQFWMAKDPQNDDLFTREGNFREYDSLRMYYFGIGGNTNSTTRFRKYAGNGERVLIHDLQKEEYLLEPNKTYTVKTVIYDGVTKVYVDDEEFFSYEDEEPLSEGYFGFRTTESRHEIDNLKIYSLQ